MEEKYLYQLAEFVLPSDVLHYFSIVKIKSDSSSLRIYLDEKMEKELSDDLHFESKGFMDAVEVTDFPIRDHKVILVLRRRRWIDTRTGKSFSLKESTSKCNITHNICKTPALVLKSSIFPLVFC
jgi:hypothetical protein